MLVGVFDKLRECLGGGEIPEVALGEVLPCGRVDDPASFVGLLQGKTRSLPLVPKPLFHSYVAAVDGKPRFARVLHADLGDGWDPTDAGRVDVSSNMRDALIPDACAPIFPPVLREDWMDVSPTDFSVPEPKRGEWG